MISIFLFFFKQKNKKLDKLKDINIKIEKKSLIHLIIQLKMLKNKYLPAAI